MEKGWTAQMRWVVHHYYLPDPKQGILQFFLKFSTLNIKPRSFAEVHDEVVHSP